MDNPKLPHLRMPQEQEKPFETLDLEMAKVFRHIHPDYSKPDEFGNKAVTKDDTKDDTGATGS